MLFRSREREFERRFAGLAPFLVLLAAAMVLVARKLQGATS